MKRLIKFTMVMGLVLIGTVLSLIGLSHFISHRQASLLPAPPLHGTSFLLAYDPAQLQDLPDAVERLKEVMRMRFSRVGVRIFWQPLSPDQVRITAPIEKEGDAVLTKDYISHGGLLEFRLIYPDKGELLRDVDTGKESTPPDYHVETYIIHGDGNENSKAERLLVKTKPDLSGNRVSDSHAYFASGSWGVALKFDTEGTKEFARITEKHKGHRFAIMLDGVIQAAPVISDTIYGGAAVITGRYNEQQARELANILDCPLPIPIKVIEVKTF